MIITPLVTYNPRKKNKTQLLNFPFMNTVTFNQNINKLASWLVGWSGVALVSEAGKSLCIDGVGAIGALATPQCTSCTVTSLFSHRSSKFVGSEEGRRGKFYVLYDCPRLYHSVVVLRWNQTVHREKFKKLN